MDPDTTQLTAYALSVAGMTPVGDETSGPVADGRQTRQLIEGLETMRDMLLRVDAQHPDLGLKAGLATVGTLVANSQYKAAGQLLIELGTKARPFVPV